MTRRSWSAAVLLLALAGLARAEDIDHRAELTFDVEGKATFLGTIVYGFGDHSVYPDRVSPVTLRLRNPYEAPLVLDVRLTSVINSRPRYVERRVELGPKAEKALRVNMLIRENLGLRIASEGEVILEQSLQAHALEGVSAPVLAIHGPEARIPRIDGDGSGFWCMSNSDEDLPFDPPTLFGLSFILFKGTDPQAWAPEQRQAIEMYLRAGGTIAFLAHDRKQVGVETFFASFPGEPQSYADSLSSKMFVRWRWKRAGKGRILITEEKIFEDYLKGAAEANYNGQLSQAFSQLAGSMRVLGTPSFPSHSTPYNNEAGDFSSLTILGFFLLAYLLLSGPGVAILYRRAPRKKLGIAVLVVIAGFVLLAPAVAIAIRNSATLAYTYTVVEFDEHGEPMQSSEIHLVSGGGSDPSLTLRGPRELVGILPHMPTSRVAAFDSIMSTRRRSSEGPISSYDVRRASGQELGFESVPLQSWGRLSLYTLARPELEPIEAQVTDLGKQRFRVRVRNTSPHDLRDIVFGTRVGGELRHVLIAPRLPKGSPAEMEVDFAALRKANKPIERLNELIRTPRAANWQGWERLPDYSDVWIVCRVGEPLLEVSGAGISAARHTTVWFQGAEFLRRDGSRNVSQAWAGMTLSSDIEESGSPRIVSIVPGSPAAKAELQVGDRVISCDDTMIRSAAQLQEIIRRSNPGDVLELSVRRDDRYNRYDTEFRLTLGRRPGSE